MAFYRFLYISRVLPGAALLGGCKGTLYYAEIRDQGGPRVRHLKSNECFPSYLLHGQVNPLKSIHEGARSMIDQRFLANSSCGVVRMSSIPTAPANTANAL